MGDKLLKMLEESTLVQGIIALVLLCVIAYMFVSGKPVPEALVNFFALVLGYYFGTKAQQSAQRYINSIKGGK